MYLEIQTKIRAKFTAVVEETFGVRISPPLLDTPPNLEMGDLSIASCFELAKQLRKPPRKIADQLAGKLLPLEGVERVSVAGAGYVNFHLDRANLAAGLFRMRSSPSPLAEQGSRKILVEHTSINPNKAAHIGHLRNAVLGDTFVRLLRFRGQRVEVQNYIDNTGVQVADVVVGFVHLENKSYADVERLIQDPSLRFDYYCWDLYARVFQYYDANKEALVWRAQALKEIEEGHGETAAIAELVSTAIVRAHLATMLRVNVRYDLLAQESEILRLDFWKYAFELMKQNGAIRFEDSGKNAGCWVMSLADDANAETTDEESGGEDVKIIVRSNGTVTYVGKDIAYHLWKFGLLGKDFGYRLFHRYADGHPVWQTTVAAAADVPAFGGAAVAYAVIDTRQSYLQNIVAKAFRALGYREQAENLHHFAYEVVGLTPRCAEEMGVALSDEARERSYIEVSGRKGQGIKADDLIDRLIEKALQEVQARQMTEDTAEQETYARMIAVAALRYFLLKFSRRMIIAFDFKEALAFEGETGPYLQYSVVRARNIFRKYQESHPEFRPEALGEAITEEQLQSFYSGPEGAAFWDLTLLAAQLESVAEQSIAVEEPAVVSKYAFRLAQVFNNFYHRFHVLSEEEPARQTFLLFLVHLTHASLNRALDLLGIEVPERM
ncbi:MAG: arginine--tRNA ligase [Terriglobia bacterium]